MILSAGTKPPLAQTCRLTGSCLYCDHLPWSRYGAGRRLRSSAAACQREALAAVQFEDRTQVATGLAGLQLDGEVTRVQGGGKTLAKSDGFQVVEALPSEEGEAAAAVFGEGELCSEVLRTAGDGELGTAGRLAGEQGAGLDRLELEI